MQQSMHHKLECVPGGGEGGEMGVASSEQLKEPHKGLRPPTPRRWSLGIEPDKSTCIAFGWLGFWAGGVGENNKRGFKKNKIKKLPRWVTIHFFYIGALPSATFSSSSPILGSKGPALNKTHTLSLSHPTLSHARASQGAVFKRDLCYHAAVLGSLSDFFFFFRCQSHSAKLVGG